MEKNPIGTKVIFNDKPAEKAKKMQRPSKSLTLSSRHREQKEKDEKKKQRPIAKIQPITKQPGETSDPFPGQTQFWGSVFYELKRHDYHSITWARVSVTQSQTNMYARKEMLNKSKVTKESKKSEKKEKPKQKDDEEGLSGKELMALVKRKQRQGLMTGKKSTETEKKSPGIKDGAPERKKPRLSDGGDISPRRMTETPKKMRHPSDPRATPEAGETDPRRQARKRLREALSQRSKESKDLKMDLQSISMLVAKIEKQLHEVYKGPTKDYKVNLLLWI